MDRVKEGKRFKDFKWNKTLPSLTDLIENYLQTEFYLLEIILKPAILTISLGCHDSWAIFKIIFSDLIGKAVMYISILDRVWSKNYICEKNWIQ